MEKRSKWGMNLIHRLSQILFGLVLFAALLDAGLMVYLGFAAENGAVPDTVKISVPAKVELNEMATYHSKGEAVNMEVVSVDGSLLVAGAPRGMIFLLGGFVLLILLAAAVALLEFVKMMGRLKADNYFEARNVKALRHVAQWMAGIWLLVEVGQMIIFSTVTSRIEFENLTVRSDHEMSFQLLFVALFVWVLGYIFEEGLRIKHEQELTI